MWCVFKYGDHCEYNSHIHVYIIVYYSRDEQIKTSGISKRKRIK